MISTVPNRVIFNYKKKQKIVIFGNVDKVEDCIYLELTPEEFKQKIKDLKIDIMPVERELKNLKFTNGIIVKEEHIILYLNVNKKNVFNFSTSLKSFKYE